MSGSGSRASRVSLRRTRHIALMALLLALTGIAGGQKGPVNARLLQSPPAVDLSSTVQPGPGSPPNAYDLLVRFERQLLDETSGEDVERTMLELERLGAGTQPGLRLRQRSTWDFGNLVELGLGTSLTWLLSDPQGDAQRALVAKRLELAKHEDRSQRGSRLREFRRSLRLLAHLEEVEALLARHRGELLALRPHWQVLERAELPPSLAGPAVAGGSAGRATRSASAGSAVSGSATDEHPAAGPGVPPFAVGTGQIGFLEVVHALERTRRERSLLLLSLAARSGYVPAALWGAPLGRPPLPDVVSVSEACLEEGRFETEETVRAGLLFEEALLASRADDARSDVRVALDVSANGLYRNSASSRPFNADIGVALRVTMPTVVGVSGEMSLAATPAGLSQEASVGWPGFEERADGGTDRAARNYRLTLERARIDALRRVAGLQDARERLRLRELQLAVASRSATSARGRVELLDAGAQAKLALLNAELEVDLALIEVGAVCGGEGAHGRPDGP